MSTLSAILGSIRRFRLFTPRSIVGFAWRFALFYLLLAVIPRGGFREVYAKAFHAGGNAVFRSFREDVMVRFTPSIRGGLEQDTTLVFGKRLHPDAPKLDCSGWIMAYLPLATFVALILATPLPWSRRGQALVWGFLWLHAFILLRMLMLVVYGFCEIRVFNPGDFWHWFLYKLIDIVGVSPVTSFVVPILVWILVSFRRGDWQAIMEKTLRYPPPQTP